MTKRFCLGELFNISGNIVARLQAGSFCRLRLSILRVVLTLFLLFFLEKFEMFLFSLRKMLQ